MGSLLSFEWSAIPLDLGCEKNQNHDGHA